MSLLLRTLRTFVITVAVGGTALGVAMAALIPGTVQLATAHHYTGENVEELRELSQRSTVYTADGKFMGSLGLENRQATTFDQIPKSVINAVVSIEDRTFWTNPGIDPSAVMRAFLTNLTSGGIEQGASTITQQLIKNRILTPKRDVNRKIKEINYALRITRKFSKEKILTEYLNTVYFGQNSYGILSAAERFFQIADPATGQVRGKQMSELTLGEAALLAGVINTPAFNDPFDYPDRARLRRALVLKAEVSEGYITQVEADAANQEPLPTVRPPAELRPLDYLVAEVQQRLLNDPRMGATPEERKDNLLRGGLKITTTFDSVMQEQARAAAVAKKPSNDPAFDVSIVAIDPATGAVRAMVGGPDFANAQYNVATHKPGRQPGSTWKIITLAAALQYGYSPQDIVDGDGPCSVPKVFPNPQDVTRNYEGGGGVGSIRTATAASTNCAFVRLSTSVGQDRVIDMATKMGLKPWSLLTKHLTLSLGTVEAPPLEMASVAATVAAGGVYHEPYFVQKVVTPAGKVLIDESAHAGVRAMDEAVAACTADVLRGVVTGGTGTAARLAGQTAAGKTGTTDAGGDAWFVGFTRQLATSVWYGRRASNRGGAGTGGVSSAPIFKEFMDSALEGQPDLGLPAPGPVCARPGQFVNADGGRSAEPIQEPGVVVVTPTTTPAGGGGATTTTRPPSGSTTTAPPVTLLPLGPTNQ